MRSESRSLEKEYQEARVVLESRKAHALDDIKTKLILDGERSAREAQEGTSGALSEVFETIPTTPHGAAALLRFIANFVDEDGVINDLTAEGLVGDAIRNAADVLEQRAQNS